MSINDILVAIDDFLWDTPFIALLIICGLVLVVRSGFFSFTHFGYTMKMTFGSLTNKREKTEGKGQLSPFEAVCTAMGGCIGMGNIAGVAAAVSTGGPGAVFWMWVWALIGMTVKSAEVALGCYYRSKDSEGEYYGGPTFYIEKGILQEQGHKWGKVLMVGFAIGMLIQYLGGSQAYNISESLYETFGLNQIVFVLIYSAFLLYIIWKGVPRIAKFASTLVPFMCILYLIGGIVMIIVHIDAVPGTFASIFKCAFTSTAAAGGTAGYAVKTAIATGISRSMNSNEAGQGTSPMIHAKANTIHPVRQGLWGQFEVFVDTIIVCSVTAISILVSGALDTGKTSVGLTIAAFSGTFGRPGEYFIAFICFLFGITTTAGWFVFYSTILHHILKDHVQLADKIEKVLKICYPIPNIVIVIMIVATGSGPDMFWTIVDISLVVPVLFNIIALLMLSGKYGQLVKDYRARYLHEGKVDPNFKVFYEEEPPVEEAVAAEEK